MTRPVRPIRCEWCHSAASFVWVNDNPGPIDENPAVPTQQPLEVHTETATCEICQNLAEMGALTELIDRALRNFANRLGGTPPGDWRETAWRAFSARLAEWMIRRHSYYRLAQPGGE